MLASNEQPQVSPIPEDVTETFELPYDDSLAEPAAASVGQYGRWEEENFGDDVGVRDVVVETPDDLPEAARVKYNQIHSSDIHVI